MSDSEDMPLAARKRQQADNAPTTDDDNIDSGSDSDTPLGKRRRPAVRKKVIEDDDVVQSSDSEVPLVKRVRTAERKSYKEDSDDDGDASYKSSDSDTPLAAKKAPSAKTNGTSKSSPSTSKTNGNKGTSGKKVAPKIKEESSSDSDAPLAKKASTKKDTPSKSAAKSSKSTKVKSEPIEAKLSSKKRAKDDTDSKSKVKKVKKEEEEEEEDDDENENAWWLNNTEQDDTVKWKTLSHNGVYFPPPYVPHGVKMLYDGKPVTLAPEVEEVASFFGALLYTEHAENPTFQENFFKDFSKLAKKHKTVPEIKSFAKCDFTLMYEYFQQEKEKKKLMTKEQKQALKDEKQALEEMYGTCYLDGRKEKVGNFRMEPPGLFRGRGKHPKTGCLKLRVLPEQVTLNLSKDAPIPKAPEGHKWQKIVHDDTKTWLATWKENVNDSTKYVFLAAGSSLKGQSDFKKFETARELKKCVAGIRKAYMADLKDKKMFIRQRATAMYLIDRLALRAGNEKGEDEADTVGCCSLRFEHVTLEKPNIMHLDFLGKDSIRFQKTMEVDDQVFKNIRLFKREPAQEGDELFDRLKTSELNKHLQSLMKGLTAKVFRTYNASFTFQDQLQKLTPAKGTVAEKLLAYNRANREVAVLCNHQRAVSKGHALQMDKIVDKIRALKYQKMKLKQTILTLEPKLKKKRPEFTEPESDLEDDWIGEHEVQLMAKEREKVKAKWEKENEKRKENKEKPMTEKELKEMLKEVDAREKELAKERKSGVVPGGKGATVEKCEAQLLKLDERIAATRTAMVDKEENKQTALGTSKINYIDPRISAAWCQKYDVPLEKIFTKTLRDKFKWAMTVDADWEF
ncbi:DNA topoisomerase 1 [Entomortierella chlamydospora]|uniref:DNA topoisomerase I n=1 Tax=Entomortierella chlamydospora TaxID=101097 RepID=A0A9P6SZD2_9FUNG|nr:DNA topoisomerase 1 [Entomortierella chlamydospora]KAG0013600.1 DNA topoisomerase 1 [Entomortierella chlamydospora]